MVSFKVERIPEVIAENLNPSFLLLNLDPRSASKSSDDDLTTVIITWLSVLFVLIPIILFLIKKRF